VNPYRGEETQSSAGYSCAQIPQYADYARHEFLFSGSGPSWDEYVALSEKDKNAINAELYDFAHLRLEVLSYLQENGIREINSASQNIQIQIDPDEVITYLRNDFDHPSSTAGKDQDICSRF